MTVTNAVMNMYTYFMIKKVMNTLTNTLPNTMPSMKVYLKHNSQFQYTL